MEPAERKAKEAELYGLMEQDVMRNSEEMRGFLGDLLSKRNQRDDGKALIDAIYPKVMTHQSITDEMLEKLAEGREDKENYIASLRDTISFIQEYQKGELDISQMNDGKTEDNEK